MAGIMPHADWSIASTRSSGRLRARPRTSNSEKISDEEEGCQGSTPTAQGRGAAVSREASRGETGGAHGGGVAIRRPHRAVRRGEVAGDPSARGPRLLLRRQPAGGAAADAGGA